MWAVSSAVVLVWASVAMGASPVVAHRTSAAVALDGRLDEAAWSEATLFEDFVESFPSPGAAPAMRTSVRVLFDDAYVYLGIECFDPHPERIVRNLGRRDTLPASDWVEIAIDSNGDRRTAYDFTVNAAGVLRDKLLFNNLSVTETWDAVWDARVMVDDRGWIAEVEIPLRVLRFSAERPTWGLWVRRNVPRTHQTFDSTLIPREANTFLPGAPVVSRFGELSGLAGLKPRRDFELTPYLAARGTIRPQFSDSTRPNPRLFDPSFELGADLKLALTSTLSLNAAVNPDFGQVEADQVIQNLSTNEAFFPEKRPFFLQGLDLFQPVGAEYDTTQQLFYSRRIGLEAPILAAVKLTGSLVEHLDVGVLDSVVMGAGNPSLVPTGYGSPSAAELEPYEANPDRRWQFHPRSPLHFGPNDALPAAHPVTTNYFAAVARHRLDERASLGAMFTAATPLEARCRREEFASEQDFLDAACESSGTNALAVDWSLRTKSGEWGTFGQVEATQHVGGEVTLVDGVKLKPGALGAGGHLRAGKLGGEPFRFDVVYVFLSPTVDFNAMGFQPYSNFQWADLNLHYVRPNGVGPFRALSLYYNLDLNWSTDGRGTPRGVNTFLGGEAQLSSFHTVGVVGGLEDPQYDTREIPERGLAFQRQTNVFLKLYGNSDPNQPFIVNGDVFGLYRAGAGALPSAFGWGFDAELRWQPTSALETRLDASFGARPMGARYVDELADGSALLFGSQHATLLSLTLRQQVVITPRLSVQVYAQLFSGAVAYSRYWSAGLDGTGFVGADALSAYAFDGDSPNQHTSVLNLNVVLRWEYRLGSTIFLVYSRSQHERARGAGEVAPSDWWPSQLFAGPATDTFLLKWTYWWTV
jgi:hypothetical protein